MVSAWIMNDAIGTTTLSTMYRLLILWFFYHVVRALYNISPLHRLSHTPGPKLAAMTPLYEFWYDMIKFGTYTNEVARMHDTYGEC